MEREVARILLRCAFRLIAFQRQDSQRGADSTNRTLLHAIKEPLHEESYWLAAMSGVVRGPAGNNDCRIYVGNLPPDIRTKDVEDVFYKYGTIRDIDLKNRRGGPPFAFIEFEDPR